MKIKIFILSIIFLLVLFTGAHAKQFYPVKYNFWTSGSSATVGKPIDMPIYVQNLGLLPDSYNVTVVYSGGGLNPDVIRIDNAVSQTGELDNLEIGKTSARLTLLSSTPGSITLRVYVMSITDSLYNPTSTCTADLECSYLGSDYECMLGKCARYTDVILRAGMASLPDFGWFGLLQIILIASVLVFLKFK